MNNCGTHRRCTKRRRAAIEFLLALAATITTMRCHIRRAWSLCETIGSQAPLGRCRNLWRRPALQ